MHFDRVGLQLDRDVAVSRIEIEKVVADDLALVAHAQHEPAKAKVRIVPHDMEKDRIRADRHHRLRAKFGHLLEPGAKAAAEDEDRNFCDIQWHPPSSHQASRGTALGRGFCHKPIAGCKNATKSGVFECFRRGAPYPAALVRSLTRAIVAVVPWLGSRSTNSTRPPLRRMMSAPTTSSGR